MYVGASDLCNELVFTTGANAVGTTSTQRNWSIKITQVSCDSDKLAPEGCTQYFTGSTTGMVQSYNYDGGTHLAYKESIHWVTQTRVTISNGSKYLSVLFSIEKQCNECLIHQT